MPAVKTETQRASPEDVRLALARAVATRKVPNEVIATVAKRLSESKFSIRGIDVCAYGICLDYFFDRDEWWQVLPDIMKLEGARVHTITVFPWGIPWPDIFRVRVEQEFDELAAFAMTAER